MSALALPFGNFSLCGATSKGEGFVAPACARAPGWQRRGFLWQGVSSSRAVVAGESLGWGRSRGKNQGILSIGKEWSVLSDRQLLTSHLSKSKEEKREWGRGGESVTAYPHNLGDRNCVYPSVGKQEVHHLACVHMQDREVSPGFPKLSTRQFLTCCWIKLCPNFLNSCMLGSNRN